MRDVRGVRLIAVGVVLSLQGAFLFYKADVDARNAQTTASRSLVINEDGTLGVEFREPSDESRVAPDRTLAIAVWVVSGLVILTGLIQWRRDNEELSWRASAPTGPETARSAPDARRRRRTKVPGVDGDHGEPPQSR
jgi:hypothetical protein